jgi:hypothetical protein
VLTDLVQIRRLGEKRRPENERFRRWIKTHDYSDSRLRRRAAGIQEQIDCAVCGNCCRVATAKVTPRDVERLAKHLGMTQGGFVRDCTMEDQTDGRILRRTGESGCVFLSGTQCTVYEARPNACELFPHTVKGEGSLASRMWQFIDRATYCPIVYNTLEAWKEETGFSARPR